ncbi:hypothetical protein CONPUDRAFT_157843 [Coniophora puteana RWD-64-598 SS2]|uniref:SUI1 domain-containing protein n=1 Tax=Coniophora puteana (strain RWD-64-598) TaxID=741705 RepID=A0A5M3MC90_CONPW|nr:uncharacterized protein CONPUDRAFT_157843 [Coniophora puteana RWD-64-598 SS2]EIW76663.1 hypothetical protein CONPUDRAFT_157843 [Coniophora puteana RWD-64-598 SS2]
MFKKPLGNLKTSAPIRSSDRRKFKERVTRTFSISADVGDTLVPDGLQSAKFITHLDEPGVAYLAPDGDPIWFTIGKGKDADELIPSVYTLWKHPNLLPVLSTPSAVVPVLIGGADLMIPGVFHHPANLVVGQLVSITTVSRDGSSLGAPLAVARADVDASVITQRGKGKAARVLHTWKDHLFTMGRGGDPPEGSNVTLSDGEEADIANDPEETNVGKGLKDLSIGGAAEISGNDQVKLGKSEFTPSNPASKPAAASSFSKEEVSDILRASLIQAIATTVSSLPAATFPIPASTFYSAHILPARPASSQATPIDIKHSSYKSLTTFLKATEKDGLVKLKDLKGDILILSINAGHVDVKSHAKYTTIRDVEAKKERQEQRERAEQDRAHELVVNELWRPHLQTLSFFQQGGFDTEALYTHQDLKSTLNSYIAAHHLTNPNDQAYVNVDGVIRTAISSKKPSETASTSSEPLFVKREELIQQLSSKMQSWHQIYREGDSVPPPPKKGQLKRISAAVKTRQGNRVATLITGFEPYLLDADELAEELRKTCASATSVSPLAGKNAGLEIFVQGKQVKPVVDLLISKGVPKQWIDAEIPKAKPKGKR